MANNEYYRKRNAGKKGSHSASSSSKKTRSSSNSKRKSASSYDDEPKAIKKMKAQSAKEREKQEKFNKVGPTGGKKKKKQSKHPKLKMFLKIFIILMLILCIVGAGVIAGVFFGLFGDDFEITKEELTIAAANSVVVDQSGNVVANLSGDEKRKIITLEDMADYLPKAYVAIEDERFYQHDGVDIKRTAGAILQTLVGKSSYGGSTITQQLVKNITKDDQSSGIQGILRKVKEWAKAYQVERMISKDQILELYLNILFVGGNMHGVELGAEYYFAKSAKDLDLAECAFLAGINNSPNSYNPYGDTDNTEKIKKRSLTVLSKMKELGYIENEDEYNAAVEKVNGGFTFQKAQIASENVYSYHTDAAISQVIDQVMEEKNISRELAENYVYGSGLTIYSTVDTTVQARLETEYAKSKYIVAGRDKNEDGSLKNEHTQSGMAVVDYKTGYVLGIEGGLGEKTESRGWNRATQMTKQTGSSMKPLSVIAPGLEEKIIQASTVYDDSATDFGGGYRPKDWNAFQGEINIRDFIASSQNIPALKIMAELTPSKSLEYLQKMGITSLDKKADDVLSLAIGGQTNGVSPLEMAVAYGTIANGGVCVTPTFYSKVVDSSGNIVLTPKQESTRAMSEQNAYIAQTIIKEPVTNASGTAKYCAIPGMDTAAKTGSTDDDCDRWLCGFTPYYSAACWFGFDNNEEVRGFTTNPAGLIWDAVMTDIHAPLANATFKEPVGIIKRQVCQTTGCLATSKCPVYTEIFAEDNLPGECEGHGSQELCTESGLIANEYCPATETNFFGSKIPKEQLKLWAPLGKSGAKGSRVTEKCTIHTKPEEAPAAPKENTTPSTNTNTDTNTNTNTNTSGNNTPPDQNTNSGPDDNTSTDGEE